jgi:hypothetical protein
MARPHDRASVAATARKKRTLKRIGAGNNTWQRREIRQEPGRSLNGRSGK